MNILDHIFESLETFFDFFDADANPDLGSGNSFGKNSDPGSGIKIPDPQQWEKRKGGPQSK
jgi:hypothetical protein